MHHTLQNRPKVTISPQTQADYDEKTKCYQAWQAVQPNVTESDLATHYQVIRKNFGEDWLADVKAKAREIWPKYNKRQYRRQQSSQAKQQISQLLN